MCVCVLLVLLNVIAHLCTKRWWFSCFFLWIYIWISMANDTLHWLQTAYAFLISLIKFRCHVGRLKNIVTPKWKLNWIISKITHSGLCFFFLFLFFSLAHSISILWRKVFRVCVHKTYKLLDKQSFIFVSWTIHPFTVCWFSFLRQYFTHKQHIHLLQKQFSWHVDNSVFHTDHVRLSQLRVSHDFFFFMAKLRCHNSWFFVHESCSHIWDRL